MDSEPQGMNPRGIHRLDTAREADPKTKGEYHGAVLHVDKANIYQLGNDSQVVRHDRDRFKETPHVGEGARIGYDNGRAVMLNRTSEPSPSRGNPTITTPARPAHDRGR
ncbi:KfrB domain-containing protein [Sphingomonas sp. PAMC 26621]|uniref:KfrB domain-containing protein n=1 Tax=Sphingomonas sp. PAMC 26621 TaxID=1112213 RepID=UPI003FD26184